MCVCVCVQKSTLGASPHITQTPLTHPVPLPDFPASCILKLQCVWLHCGKSFPPSAPLYLPFLSFSQCATVLCIFFFWCSLNDTAACVMFLSAFLNDYFPVVVFWRLFFSWAVNLSGNTWNWKRTLGSSVCLKVVRESRSLLELRAWIVRAPRPI